MNIYYKSKSMIIINQEISWYYSLIFRGNFLNGFQIFLVEIFSCLFTDQDMQNSTELFPFHRVVLLNIGYFNFFAGGPLNIFPNFSLFFFLFLFLFFFKFDNSLRFSEIQSFFLRFFILIFIKYFSVIIFYNSFR